MITEREWGDNKPCDRFVLFADILGFKNKLYDEGVSGLYEKMMWLNHDISNLRDIGEHERLLFQRGQTISFMFSDSISFFSYSNSYEDALKILIDGSILFDASLRYGVPIRGGISYGNVLVDRNSHIFLGSPIIDAYQFQEELSFSGIAFDHKAETKIDELKDQQVPTPFAVNNVDTYKFDAEIPTKNGRVHHQVAQHREHDLLEENINNLRELRKTASGKGRIYLENSIQILKEWGFHPPE